LRLGQTKFTFKRSKFLTPPTIAAGTVLQGGEKAIDAAKRSIEFVKDEKYQDIKGISGETIDVKAVSVPKGWKAIIRGGNYDVSGVYVGEARRNASK
jgi:DNA primase